MKAFKIYEEIKDFPMADQCFELVFSKDANANNPVIREMRGDYLVKRGLITQAFEYYSLA